MRLLIPLALAATAIAAFNQPRVNLVHQKALVDSADIDQLLPQGNRDDKVGGGQGHSVSGYE
ncbi:unnamed protein product, partial [Aphanomyces euteiches]